LAEVPYQQDIKVERPADARSFGEAKEVKPASNIFETKMAGMNITTQQIVEATPENKLPPIEKKRPSSGVDPYRESLS
jgi:hypothetical protein